MRGQFSVYYGCLMQNEAPVVSVDLSKTEIMRIPRNFMQPRMKAGFCFLCRFVRLSLTLVAAVSTVL